VGTVGLRLGLDVVAIIGQIIATLGERLGTESGQPYEALGT